MMKPTHHTAVLDGQRVHYVTAGTGDPVYLLHGWPQTAHEWAKLFPLLMDRYTLVAPDLRGMGHSGRPESGYDCRTLGDDVYKLSSALGHEEIHVVGHDFGVLAAYGLAAQHPERVRTFAALEFLLPGTGMMEEWWQPKPGGNFLWHMAFQSLPDMPTSLIQGREEMYLKYFFSTFAYDPSAITSDDLARYVSALQQSGGLRSSLGLYRAWFESGDQVAELAQEPLTMPVLALGGEACMADMAKVGMEKVAENVCGGTLPRAGHWIPEEAPAALAVKLEELFASV
jgi:pimeloyl-ACP methyl ester carboxylesterase